MTLQEALKQADDIHAVAENPHATPEEIEQAIQQAQRLLRYLELVRA